MTEKWIVRQGKYVVMQKRLDRFGRIYLTVTGSNCQGVYKLSEREAADEYFDQLESWIDAYQKRIGRDN